MDDDDHVRMFDTTLRDGMLAAGPQMTLEQKLAIAHHLAQVGVDVIEAGFPGPFPDDREVLHEIAGAVGTPDGPVIAALAGASEEDIDEAAAALKPAVKTCINIFIPTSDRLIEQQTELTHDIVLAQTRQIVRYACSLFKDVEFTPMDASRSEHAYLYQVLTIAIEQGATILNIADTMGNAVPEEYTAMIAGIRQHVPGADTIILSTHCHNDLGLAVANSLAGVQAGARQVECTVNGIGVRGGNAALQKVVMALHVRREHYGVSTRVNHQELESIGRLLPR